MRVQPNSLNNLNPNRSPYKNNETCVIRVPKIFKDELKRYANQLDSGKVQNSTVTQELQDLVSKIKTKQRGYKSNSAGQLIKDLLAIVE